MKRVIMILLGLLIIVLAAVSSTEGRRSLKLDRNHAPDFETETAHAPIPIG